MKSLKCHSVLRNFILIILLFISVSCSSQTIYIEHIGCCGDKPIFPLEIRTDTIQMQDVYTKGKFSTQVVTIKKCNYKGLLKFVNRNKTNVLYDEKGLYLYGAFRIIAVEKERTQTEYVLLDRAVNIKYFKKMRALKEVERETRLYEKINTLIGRIDYQ